MTFRLKDWETPQRCQEPGCDERAVGVLQYDVTPPDRGPVTVYSLRCADHAGMTDNADYETEVNI